MLSLTDPINKLHLVGPASVQALNRLGIKTIHDLLYYFPRDWQDLSEIRTISDIRPNERINIRARVKKIGTRQTRFHRMSLTSALLEDQTGNVVAVWFNQPFIKNSLRQGYEYYFSGKLTLSPYGRSPAGGQLSNPAFELVKEDTIHTAGIIPLYQLTEGITQKQIRYWLKQAIGVAKEIKEFLPQDIQVKHKLLNLAKAISLLHFPRSMPDLKAARQRLAFDELFLFQLALQMNKRKLKMLPAPAIAFNQKLIREFVDSLPFRLTPSQRLAAWEILQDLGRSHPMNRLLEGEVGSGKTVVAGIAMLETALAGCQSVMLAPTEILALQHYETLQKLFKHSHLEIALLTRSHKTHSVIARSETTKQSHEIAALPAVARNDNLLQDIKTGRTKIIIGTHALLQEHIKFHKIGLLVVDEQHRFGVSQRSALTRGQTQTEPQTDADKFLYEDLTYNIRKCLFEIRKELGLGHKEIIYQKALAEKLKNSELKFEKEKPIPIIYNNKKIGIYQPDFVIENKIILELKALPFIGNLEKRQIWNYLKGSPYELALLANFSSSDVEISRIVYDTARTRQRTSASSPRQSAQEAVPHLLSMSATPIPRTLSLAMYGDLDISQLRELPSGRKKIITRLVSPDNRQTAYEFIRNEINKGRQAYVVVPLIENKELPTNSPLYQRGAGGVQEKKSAIAESEKLQKLFPEFSVGLLHGQLPSEEKKTVMQNFKANKIQILVTTTVIEVGVDVQNASVMVIENAERFGLATLHQLRGRVGRSELQSYCLLFSDPPAGLSADKAGEAGNFIDATRARLEAVVNSTDGFALAEVDLELRGPGEIIGTKQSGYIPFKIAKLNDRKLIKTAKEEAERLLDEDLKLAACPGLRQKVERLALDAHLE